MSSNATHNSQSGPSSSTTATGPAVVTTTIYNNPTSSIIPSQRQSSSVPIGAIAGGAASGVFLAVVAVVGWRWWGRCIKRKEAKKRKEALAALEVKENTRRNASSGAYGGRRRSSSAPNHEKKVKFLPSAPSTPPPPETVKAGKVPEKPRASMDAPLVRPPPLARPRQTLMRPSPLGRNSVTGEARVLVRSESANRRQPAATHAPSVQPFLTRRLLPHKPSTMSVDSAYSTQSGEEHQKRVSTSLIMAALEHLDPRKSWLGNYLLPISRQPPSGGTEHSRLSQISTTSVHDYEQVDGQPGVPIGYAYGGEDGATPGQLV
ncbi:hypothetical protein B0H21DRAFT_888349 [Amylocystis lapponica]|nr:hypothetical protein B0H21DRAFT_888349 [Amylocystis lapponica]